MIALEIMMLIFMMIVITIRLRYQLVLNVDRIQTHVFYSTMRDFIN